MLKSMRQRFSTGMAVLVLLQATGFQPGARAEERTAPRGPGEPPESPARAASLASAFQKKHRGRSVLRFEELLAQVEAQVPEVSAQSPSPRVASLREVLATTRELSERKPGRHRGTRSASRTAVRENLEIVYRFGARSFEVTDQSNRKLIRRLSKQPTLSADMLSAEARLEWTLQGALPETELLVAALEATLDVHRGLDELALLLEGSHSRGPEGRQSFYQQLDQATRNGEALFYPENLVREFVRTVAPRVSRRWDKEQQRQKLHGSFLTYRQYRSFIEAAAWSLALPPDLPLPFHLARFDYGAVQGCGYSVRHEIDILAESAGGDSRSVVQAVRELIEARPLPAVPWQSYSLAAEFNQHFTGQAPSIARRAGLHTDVMGERNRDRRREVSRRLATRMCALLGC